MDWTAEAIEALRALWAEGHSTAEIGRRMGISKNAVVGKAHRLNLPARPSPIRREAEAASGARPAVTASPAATAKEALPVPVARPAAPVMPVATLAPASKPIASAASLAAARPPTPPRRAPQPTAVVRPFQRMGGRSCCWPIGEPGTPEFRFCTAEAISGKPYCPEHASIAYVKARDRRDDAA